MSQEPIAVGARPPQSPDLLADLSDEDDDREAGSMSESESDLEQNRSPSLVEQLSHSATAEKHAAPSSCSDTTGQTAVLNNGKTTILDITTSPRESQVAKSKGQPETTPAVSKRKYLPSASHQTSRANFKETKFDTNASVTDDHSSHGDDDVDEEQNLESTHTVQFCYDFELSQTSSQGSVCEKVFPVRQSPLERARRKKLKHGHSISVNTEDQVSDRDGSSPWSSIQQIQSNEVLLDEEDITKPRSSKDTVSVQRRPQLTRPKYIEKENSDSNLLSDSSVALLHGRIGKVTPGKELTQDVAECKNQYAHSSMKLLSTRNQNIYPNFSQQAIVSRTVKSDGSTSVSTIVSENELGIELISKPHKMRVEGGHGHGSGMNTKLPEQSIFPGKSHRRPAGEHKNYSLDLDRCKGAHGQIPGCPDHECAKPSFHPPISNTIVSLFQTGSGRTIQLDKSSLMAARESLGSLHAQTVDGDIEINDEFSLGEAFHKTNVQELSTMDELIGGNSKYALGSSCEAPSVCSTNNPSFALKGYKIQDTTDISPQEPSMSSLNEVSRSDGNLNSAQPSSVSSLFSTGSRKQVSISEDSLSSAQRSLGLSSNSGNVSSAQSSSVPSLFSTGSGKQVSISADSLSSAQRSLGLSSNSGNASSAQSSSVPSLFSTGSGKQVEISEDSLSSAQRSLGLSSNSANVSSGQSSSVPSLFSTGSGKQVSISADSLSSAQRSLGLSSNSANASSAQSSSVPSLFSTGSGKQVEISEDSLSSAQRSLGLSSNSANVSSGQSSSVPSLFSTGSGKQVSISADSLSSAQRSLGLSSNSGNASSAQSSSVPSLFSTGSGKQVEISEDSLSSAQRSLGLSSNSANVSSGQSSSVPSLFSTGSGKQVSISADSLSSAQRSLGLSSNSANASSVPSLFSTGSGKQVSISEDSLSSAQRSLGLSSNSANASSVPSLFSTGSGKQVSISADSLSSAQRSLGLSSNSANASSVPSLFSTGSGKQVSISEDSLSSAQRSLGLSSNSANASSVPSLFSTGSGKQVSISEDSLSSAQRSLGLSSNSANVSSGQSSSVPSLFSTGSGKQVEISEDSLSSAQRALGLSSNSANASSVPSLFSTGSGKQVEISEDSLSSAQRVLEHATLSAESSQFKSPARLEGASIHKKFSAQQPAIASNVSTPIRPRGRLPELRVKSATSSDTRRPKRPRAFVTPFKSGGSAQKLIKRSAASAPPKFSTAIGSTSKSGPPDKPTLGIADAVARCSRSSLSKVAGFIFSQQSSSEMICESAIELGTPKWLLAINSESAACVRFSPDNGQLLGVAPFPSSEGTYDLARQRLLEVDGVDEELATDIWTANHYRWIVWKLASFQRVLGSASSNLARACTLENVVFELQYRYDRELLKVERPALRKIFEKDAPVSRHIVLCVASVAKPGLGFNLVMTDGWYSIQVIVDNFLQRLIAKKKITIGTKIHICGAAMINNEEGIGPLETVTNNLLLPKDQKARLEPRLRLSQNCTFPAKWDTKLGFRPEIILYKQLKNIQPSWGTTVPGLRAIVVRHFETQYCERDANGRWINRNAQEEDLARRSYEDRVSQARDAIVAEHERSWEDLSQGSGGSSQLKTRAALMQRRRDSVSNALAEDPRMPTRREVKTKLRILLQQPGDDCFAELVMWNPPQEFGRMYPEGCYIELNAITVVRPSVANIPRTIGLNTSKETRFRPLVNMHAKAGNVRMRIVQRIEDLCKVDHNNSNPFADVYGVLVFKTDYHAFLCSESGSEDIMSIRLGPKSLLLDDTIVFGALICVRDLLVQLREPSTDVLACTETHHTILVANPSKTLLDEARWQPFANAVGQFQKFLLADEAVEILKSARERAERITMGKALSTNQNHHTPVKSAEHLSTSSSSKSTGELHSHAPQARNSAAKSTILQSSVQAPAEDPKRIQRLRLQQEKQAQWREKYLSRKAAQGLAVAPTSPNRLASQKHHTPKELGSKDSTGTRNTLSGSKSLTLFARSTDLSHVMVGRKTVDIRKATQQIQNLRMGDLISFTDSHQRQIVRVKAAIPYDNVCSALEHEPLSRLFPRISSREDAQILLSQHISLSDAVYSLHFEIPNDEINMPGWATPSPNTKSRSRLQNQQSS